MYVGDAFQPRRSDLFGPCATGFAGDGVERGLPQDQPIHELECRRTVSFGGKRKGCYDRRHISGSVPKARQETRA